MRLSQAGGRRALTAGGSAPSGSPAGPGANGAVLVVESRSATKLAACVGAGARARLRLLVAARADQPGPSAAGDPRWSRRRPVRRPWPIAVGPRGRVRRGPARHRRATTGPRAPRRSPRGDGPTRRDRRGPPTAARPAQARSRAHSIATPRRAARRAPACCTGFLIKPQDNAIITRYLYRADLVAADPACWCGTADHAPTRSRTWSRRSSRSAAWLTASASTARRVIAGDGGDPRGGVPRLLRRRGSRGSSCCRRGLAGRGFDTVDRRGCRRSATWRRWGWHCHLTYGHRPLSRRPRPSTPGWPGYRARPW